MQNDSIINERIGIATIVYGVYCALLPLNMILNFTGFTINKYIGILASAFFLLDIIRKRAFELKTTYLIILMFMFWSWLTLVWSVDFSRSVSQLTTLSSLIIITIMGLLRDFNQKEITFLKYCMIIPASLIVAYLAPNKAVSYSRATLQSSAGSADHNSLAANILFPLIICVNGIKYEQKKWVKIINVICAISMVISLLLIASRGSILAAVGAFIVYFYYERKDEGMQINYRNLIKRLAVAFIVIGIGYYILNTIDLPALSRLKWDQLFANSGYGRTNLWAAAWRALWDSILRVIFGYGYGTETSVTFKYTGRLAGIHNVYLEHWATTGIIGLTILLSLFVKTTIYARKNKDNLSVALMIALMIICFPLGFLTNKGAWNIIMFAYIGLQCKNIGLGETEK